MRILALDYGDKTVGVAITDGLNLMAHPMNTIFREKPTKLRQTLSKIIEIIDDNKVKTIVIGLPKNLDGSEKDRCTKTYEFANKLRTRLQNRDIEIIMHDERYTTTEANSILDDIKIPKTERKKTIDSIAASIILESYLNEVNNG